MKTSASLLVTLLGAVMPLMSAAQQSTNASAANTDPITPTETIALFNGNDLSNWLFDVPSADYNPNITPSFIIRDDYLVSMGEPRGHLITRASYENYQLDIEYRFSSTPGNAGVLIHASTPRALYDMFPQSIEVQMQSGDAGDFWCIAEDIQVENMETRRPREEGQQWGGLRGDARRILNLTDNAERPLGEWNHLRVRASADGVDVWVNGELVNSGFGASVSSGQIALQAEGSEVEVRLFELSPL